MFEILSQQTFLVVMLGTVLLAISAGMVGCLSYYKGQSLIGDPIGHAAFPGVIGMFMVFQVREPALFLLGAAITGTLCYLLIQTAQHHRGLSQDAVMAIFLSGFFGAGLVLKTLIQGNPAWQGASQAGLQNYIFGQAAYMMTSDVVTMVVVAFICLMLVLLFFKELKVFVFDEGYAQTIGYPKPLLHLLLMVMVMLLISTGLKAVGAVLISSMLILPPIAASQWSCRFSAVMMLAALIGGGCAFVGTWLSFMGAGISTGPTMILCMGAAAGVSMLIGPYGPIARRWRRRS